MRPSRCTVEPTVARRSPYPDMTMAHVMRTNLGRTLGLVCSALGLAACSSDGNAQADTGSSEGGQDSSSGNPNVSTSDDTTPVDTTNNPETGADTASSGPSSSSGGACVIPKNLLMDGGFEGGIPNPSWGEWSYVFMTPLCSPDTCGSDPSVAEPADGDFWVWFGINVPEEAGVSQAVEIGAADSVTLTFDLWISSVSSSSPNDRMEVHVDGDEVFEVRIADQADYASYTPVEIDMMAYADGGTHEIEIVAFLGGGDTFTNINVDNVSLNSCGEGMGVSEGDTVTGGGGGIPGTDTYGTISVCDETLPNTVPQTAVANNSFSGNESTGTCTAQLSDDGNEYVFEFTAPTAGTYAFDTSASAVVDTVLYIYDACMDGTELACDEDSGDGLRSRLVYTLTAGQTIAIVVDGYDASQVGDIALDISQIDCGAPIDLGDSVPVMDVPGTTLGAGDDVTGTCGGGGAEDVTYGFTAPAAGIYRIDTAGSSFDTVVYAYDGVCGAPGDELACNAAGTDSEITVVLDADEEIVVIVDGATEMESGDFDISITSTPLAGDCCSADGTPGCADAAITACVCDLGPQAAAGDCCGDAWSPGCVGLAASQCNAGCTLTPAGSCCTASASPGCDVAEVQDCVCGFDDACCNDAWSELCVLEAEAFCLADCGG